MVVLWLPCLGNAQTDLTLGNGRVVTVSDKGLGGLTASSETTLTLQDWPVLCVKPCVDCFDPCESSDLYNVQGAPSTVSANGRTILMNTVFMANLLVTRTIFAPDTQVDTLNGHVRYMDSFRNETGNDIQTTIYIGSSDVDPTFGRVAPHDASVIRSHYLDDTGVEPLDRWFVVDDADVNGTALAVGILTWGGGGLAPFIQEKIAGLPGVQTRWGFRLTVPANETVSVMTAVVLETQRVNVLAEVPSLLMVTAVGVLAELTEAELNGIANFDVDTINAAPVANAGGPYTVDEGSSVALTALDSHDLNEDVLSYGWHFTSTPEPNAAFDETGANVTTVFADDGLYPVRLTVSDVAGKVDRDYASVRVNNVVPSVDSLTTSSPILEGDELLVRVVASDPGADELTYHYDWENRGVFGDPAGAEVGRRFFDDGSFILRVMVRDDDGAVRIAESPVEVGNAPPEVLQVVLPPEVGEGSLVPVTVIAQDPGNDPMTYALDLDNDGVFEIDLGSAVTGSLSYPDNGFYQLQARACDDQGLCAIKASSISVGNVAPTIIRVEVTSPINEGETAMFTVFATDSESDVPELQYGFDFDNDGDFSDDLIQSTASATHTFLNAGQFRVGIRVSDSDGGVSTTSVDVTVDNLSPSVALNGPVTAIEGETERFFCSGIDQGNAFLAIDWDMTGDGLYERPNTQDRIDYAFPNEGTYVIRCRVRDGLGAVAETNHTVYVSNASPAAVADFGDTFYEGSESIVRVIATDVPGDQLTYRFDFDGDGAPDNAPDPSNLGRHTYFSEGVYPVTVWVSDQTDETRVVGSITVLNRAPNALLIMTDQVAEGETVTARAEVSDPGGDPIYLSWDLDGDGVAEFDDETPVVGGVAERIFVVVDDGRLNLSVWARDDEGAQNRASASLIVTNVAPKLFDGYSPLPAQEGSQYASVIPVFDPAGTYDPLVYQLLAGPDSIDLDPSTGLLLWTPSYEEYLQSPTSLTIRVSDGDTGVLETNLQIIVEPRDEDADGLPDTYETRTCDAQGACLDPTDRDDASSDLDGDGLTNLEEWQGGTDPFEYDGPDGPTLLAPLDGVRVNSVAPELEVEIEQYEGTLDAWVRFEVYVDELATDLLLSELVPIDARVIVGLSLSALTLTEDSRYFWRARSETGLSETEWSETFSFIINALNTPPPMPTLISPEDGVTLGQRAPTFTARTVPDSDGDTVRYLFRFYRQNGEIETLGYGFVEGDFTTFSQPQREGVNLLWEVVAIDEVGAQSEPTPQWTFLIDAINKAPNAPEIRTPAPSEILETNPIEVELGGSIDPDGHDFTYGLRVYGDEMDPVVVGTVQPTEDGSALFISEARLDEDRGYDLVVYAEDEFGARSDTTIRRVFLSSENDAPSKPAPIEPINLSPIVSSKAVLIWTLSTDPERSAVTYRITICTEMFDAVDTDECFEQGLIQTNGFDFRADARVGQTYFWSVEAVDDTGLASAPSEVWSFKVLNADDALGDGCECNQSGSHPPTLWLVLVMSVIGWRRRKSSLLI